MCTFYTQKPIHFLLKKCTFLTPKPIHFLTPLFHNCAKAFAQLRKGLRAKKLDDETHSRHHLVVKSLIRNLLTL